MILCSKILVASALLAECYSAAWALPLFSHIGVERPSTTPQLMPRPQNPEMAPQVLRRWKSTSDKNPIYAVDIGAQKFQDSGDNDDDDGNQVLRRWRVESGAIYAVDIGAHQFQYPGDEDYEDGQ